MMLSFERVVDKLYLCNQSLKTNPVHHTTIGLSVLLKLNQYVDSLMLLIFASPSEQNKPQGLRCMP